MLQSIDSSIKAKISEMVDLGVVHLDEMKVHLKQFVCASFSANIPPQNNRRFWPLDKDISNYIQLAISQKM